MEEMLADVCDPDTGRCYGNVVKVRQKELMGDVWEGLRKSEVGDKRS